MSLITSTYLNKSTEFYTVFPIIDDKEEGLSLEPLFDFSGTRIGTIVISKNFDLVNEDYRKKFLTNVLIKLGQLSLVLIIALLIYNVWLMRPLHKIKTALTNYFQGKDEALNDMVIGKDREIENLARILKKVCELSKNKDKT